MRTWVVILVVIMAACGTAEESPVGLMPRDTFIEVLLQAHLIEAATADQAHADSAWAEMFAAQGVDRYRFRTTYAWYTEHPAELKAVYNEVLTGLQQRVDRPDSAKVIH
ncbi:MAG TPA: DUF4296 domain-containing protein [Flavobacteriales bacterium]|nr:DUF4296 domain-containing protein [Flavobacteriales bacterium]